MKNKLNIAYEDRDLLVVDKPSGLVVNRAETIKEETLQDQLVEYFQLGDDPGIGDRAGIVHRLDRETSGLLLVAKTQKAFEMLQAQFKDRLVKKEYIALVHQHLKEKTGSINLPISRVGKFGKFGIAKTTLAAARDSTTEYQVVNYYHFSQAKLENFINQSRDKLKLAKSRINYLRRHARDYTLVRLSPKTGRTHQVRVHLKSLGHPPVSDLIYTPKKLLKFDRLWCTRLFLHAKSLEFKHHKTGKTLKITSDLPKDLEHAISNLTIDN